MQQAIETFVAEPTEANLEPPRSSGWPPATTMGPPRRSASTTARSTNPKRSGGPDQRWPLDEAYIDYVEGARRPASSTTPPAYPRSPLTLCRGQREGWRDQHLHRLARHRVPPVGPGPAPTARARPVTDYTTATERGSAGRLPAAGHPAADRRPHRRPRSVEPLGLAISREFQADTKEALGKIFRGIGALTVGELAGERMNVALRPRTRRTSTPASATTPTRTSETTPRVSRWSTWAVPRRHGPSLTTCRAGDPNWTELGTQIEARWQKPRVSPAPFDEMITGDDA